MVFPRLLVLPSGIFYEGRPYAKLYSTKVQYFRKYYLRRYLSSKVLPYFRKYGSTFVSYLAILLYLHVQLRVHTKVIIALALIVVHVYLLRKYYREYLIIPTTYLRRYLRGS